jgi:hypothetical protein
MTTPAYYCLDGDVANGINPFRPGTDTIGGVAKEDDAQYLPDPDTMFTAADFNQRGHLAVGLAKVAPLARVYVKFSGGTPSVYAVLGMGSLLATGDFVLTDNGTGDTTVTCAVTHIPGPLFCGGVHPQTTSDIRGVGAVTGSGDGIRCVTRNSAGAATDTDFVVDWC